MNTSRLQYIDRGATGWEDMPSECRTPPYMDTTRSDNFARVPTMKRLCVKAFTGKSDSDTFTVQDALKMAQYIGANIGDGNVGGGVVAYVAKSFANGLISAIPEFDPGITNDGSAPPLKNATVPPGQDPIADMFIAMGKGFSFITNPMNWLAILSLLLGLGIVGVAVIKGLG